MVLTSASVYRKLQETRDSPAGARPGSEMSGEQDPWDRAESPTEPGPVQGLSASLGFFPKSGKLLKSESEDSGVEMASNEHSPSTPLGSESSFSLDGLDGFQPCTDDPAGSNAEESRSGAAGLGQPDTLQERDCQHSLSASVKLAQVLQRSRKHRMAGRSARQLSRSKRSQEGAEPYGSQQPGSQGVIAGTVEEHRQAPSGHQSPEAGSPEPCGDWTEVSAGARLLCKWVGSMRLSGMGKASIPTSPACTEVGLGQVMVVQGSVLPWGPSRCHRGGPERQL